MKARFITAVVAALVLTGCAQRYVLRLNNGQEIVAATKPKSDGHGWYRFKDANGQEMKVNQLRVREIEPQ